MEFNAARGDALAKIPCFSADRLRCTGAAEHAALVEDVRHACVDVGFFYVDVDRDSGLDSVLARMKDFFSLADSDPRKQAVRVGSNSGSFGWTPLFGEPAYQPGTIAHVESFDCGPPSGHGASGKHFVGKSVWPVLPGFRADVRNYWRTSHKLADPLLECIGSALGLGARFLANCCSTATLDTLRLLHYPANEAPADARHVGIAAHTDFECITLLYQTAPGLELRDAHGRWYNAPSKPGQIIVLLGDMLERWTNGAIQATGHRVRNTATERLSIVQFVAADPGLVVEPLPQFTSASKPARYPAVTQDVHIESELRRARANTDRTACRPAASIL